MTDVRKTTPKGFQPTRRKFISSAASAAFGFTLVPRHVLGGPGYIAPSEQLQVAGIGAGGMGGGDIATVLLGVLALRAPGHRLLWNSTDLKVTNLPYVNQFVLTEYRRGGRSKPGSEWKQDLGLQSATAT